MTLEELEAVVLQLRDSTPTLEEQLFSIGLQSWNGSTDVSGNTRFTLLAAPFALRVLSVDLSFEYWNLASSTSSFWSVTLERGNQALGFPDICTKTTAPSGADAGGEIVARTPWNFDSANWSGADLAKGELLCMNWSKTGSPAAIHLPLTATVRYRPL